MSLWTAAEIAAVTGGRLHDAAENADDSAVNGVSIDTRSIAPGDLFVALKGPNHDAHDFAEAAVEAGASVLLVDRVLPLPTVPQVVVADTATALEALGMARRDQIDGFVLGITGSVGKTGTKELAAAGFAACGKTHATQGNLNNHFGVPLTLSRMPRDTAFAVIEMGMSAPGEIRDLTRQVRPDAALITWISAAHSAFFDSTEQIAEAKAEIFDGLKPGGVAALPADNAFCALLAKRAAGARVRRFGYSPDADVTLTYDAATQSGWAYSIDGHRFELALAGRQWGGSVAALYAVLPDGIDKAAFLGGLSHVQPLKGRGKRFALDGVTDGVTGDSESAGGSALLIDESYNASPAAVAAALRQLCETPIEGQGRRVAVLGDMLELDQPEQEHAKIGALIAEMPIDVVHVSGNFGQATLSTVKAHQRGQSAPDPDSLYTEIAQAIHAGDIWLVKGSLGSRVHRIVDRLINA